MQAARRRFERNAMGAHFHGACRAHELWDCRECSDRTKPQPGPALYCAGPGCPVVEVKSLAEWDDVVRAKRGRSGR